MRAGRLRHRLIVERPDTYRDATGDELTTWVAVDTVWAAIEPLKGNERFNAGQIIADMNTQIIIRWSPAMDAMTAKWRLRHAERSNQTIYNIASVSHVNLGRREIQIGAKSGVNEG